MFQSQYQAVTAMLQSWSDLLMEGHFDLAAQRYITPLVMYMDGRPIVVNSTAELSHILADLYVARLQRGTATVKVEVLSVGLPRGQRQKVWARYIEYDLAGALVLQTDCVQFLRVHFGETRSEMLDLRDCDKLTGGTVCSPPLIHRRPRCL